MVDDTKRSMAKKKTKQKKHQSDGSSFFFTYPSEVLFRRMLGRGDVALGFGAVSCVAWIPADGGTLKIGTLYVPAIAPLMSIIPALAGVSVPVKFAILEAE